MEKISPLRASLKAFEQFRTQRAQKRQDAGSKGTTNPFGLTFKGTMIQMDVFESSKKNEAPKSNGLNETLQNVGKLTASAWVSTKSKFNSIKESIISFGNKLKENTINTWDKLNKTEISFTGLFKDLPSNLQKRSVSELEEMLRSELASI